MIYFKYKGGIYMSLTKENYTKRLVDDEISELLKVFGAISIEGPKYCGKTWTALFASKITFYVLNNIIPNPSIYATYGTYRLNDINENLGIPSMSENNNNRK